MHRGTTLAVLLCALAANLQAQTFYLMSEMTNGTSGPPFPMNPCSSCAVYPQGGGKYWVDDRNTPSGSFSSASMMTSDDLTPPGTNGIGTNYGFSPMDASYLTNGSLWIEAYSNDTQNIYLQLHNTTNAFLYQLWNATNLASPSSDWTPGQVQLGYTGTNVTPFDSILMTNAQTFFRGQQGNTEIFAYWRQDAYETNATLGIPSQIGQIDFDDVPNATNDLIVHYTLGGSARNGIDYTNLSGVATIPASQGYVSIYVQPIGPNTLTNPVESVVFTVQPDTNYLVSPDQNSVPVLIKSSSTTISIAPTGIDAVRPAAPGQPERDGVIYLNRDDDLGPTPPVTVDYEISGTASNGVDYQLLSGSITFAQDARYTNITVVPLYESPLQGTKYVTFTVLSTNGYIADSNNYSGTIAIYDQIDAVGIAGTEPAINSDGPPGAPEYTGWFSITRLEPHGFYPETVVNYSLLGGDAVNGVDYSNLTGTVDFPAGESDLSVPIVPISHWTNASKSVVMTLLPGDYVIDTNNATKTNVINNSSTQISVFWQQDAVETQGTNAAQPGIFQVQRYDPRVGYPNPLSVFYNLGGSATNGVDYTNLTGVVTFAAGQNVTNIYIDPLINTNFPGDKIVTLAVVPATNYYVNPDTNDASASLFIFDNNVQFQTVTNGINGISGGPIGSDYDPYLTNLIFSVENGFDGFDFYRLGTNITQVGGNPATNLFMTNWSGIASLPDEVYLTVVTNSASGFTNGNMFFGSVTGIGWLSSNAAMSNLSWCVLTNATETNALLLRGSLCMDTIGTFSNNLIAVTSDGSLDDQIKGVWEVDSHANPTLLADIHAELLEGVTVVRTNFGPWSGKIITGDEGSVFLYTIDNSTNITTIDSTTLFPGGIHSESIQMIPANQSLYLCDPAGSIVKLSRDYFRNYVGDLLIEDGGENYTAPAKLFIIHWDAASNSFITRRFRYSYGGTLEHCVFAPIELPAQ